MRPDRTHELSATGDLERVLAFLKGIDERASTAVERFRFGTAYLRPELPGVWSRNFVWVDTELVEPELESVLSEVERIHSGAGVSHRRIVFERELGGKIASDLAAAGWRVEATCVMVFEGNVGAPTATADVREVEPQELWTAAAAIARADPAVKEGEETIRQLALAAEAVATATHERCFAVADGEEIASYCRLFSDGRVAQIEEVGTDPAFRRLGYSRAVVLRALAESTSSHDMTFLLADEDGWPKGWYQRLGFRPIGLLQEAVRS